MIIYFIRNYMVRLKETYLKGLLLTQLYFIRGSVIAYNKKTAL